MSNDNESRAERVDEALIALRRILRATELHQKDMAQAAGLSPAKLRVLQILEGQEGQTATPTVLANQMGVSQATVTALVAQLEDRAMIMRERSNLDRRQMNVTLTTVGSQALSDFPNTLQQHFAGGFDALADWEQHMIVSVLGRVAAMLNATDIKAAPLLATGELHDGKAVD